MRHSHFTVFGCGERESFYKRDHTSHWRITGLPNKAG